MLKLPKLPPMETTKSSKPKPIVFSYRAGSNANEPSIVGEASKKYQPGKWDIWMLGITIVIDGQYFCWNAGLAVGLYSYMIARSPVAGGAYGLSRCMLGFYPAFMIGCCEALEYIAYVSTSVLSLADMIVLAAPSLTSVRPLIWATFYISALFFHLKSDRVFWTSNFQSPCSIPGALYSMSIWILAITAIAGYQGNGGVEIMALGCIVALLTLFYFGYTCKRQSFLAQENRILLVAHVMKFNGKRTAAATSAIVAHPTTTTRVITRRRTDAPTGPIKTTRTQTSKTRNQTVRTLDAKRRQTLLLMHIDTPIRWQMQEPSHITYCL